MTAGRRADATVLHAVAVRVEELEGARPVQVAEACSAAPHVEEVYSPRLRIEKRAGRGSPLNRACSRCTGCSQPRSQTYALARPDPPAVRDPPVGCARQRMQSQVGRRPVGRREPPIPGPASTTVILPGAFASAPGAPQAP